MSSTWNSLLVFHCPVTIEASRGGRSHPGTFIKCLKRSVFSEVNSDSKQVTDLL